MQTPLGPTQCVQNIEVPVFRRFLVIFLTGVAISIWHAVARFASGYAMAGSGLLRRLLLSSQRLNAVACNVQSSGLAVYLYSCGVDDV